MDKPFNLGVLNFQVSDYCFPLFLYMKTPPTLLFYFLRERKQ